MFLILTIQSETSLKHTLNNIEADNLFLCITVVNPVDEINDVGFSVPNILISTKLVANCLTQDKAINLKEEKYLGGNV